MKAYDFIFGLGAGCSVSQSLRDAGLQFASYPLDWIAAPGITKHGSPASERAVRDSLAGLMPARSDSTHLKSSVERWISPFLR